MQVYEQLQVAIVMQPCVQFVVGQLALQAYSVSTPPPTIPHSDVVRSRRLVLLSASFFFVALLFILRLS
jgi:hypothetical protein